MELLFFFFFFFNDTATTEIYTLSLHDALPIYHGDAVGIEVFDEPEVAAARHRVGLRRLFALQIRDALKYLEKNIPDLQKMAVAYMPLGTQEEIGRASCRERV